MLKLYLTKLCTQLDMVKMARNYRLYKKKCSYCLENSKVVVV